MWNRYAAWDDFQEAREVILLKEALTNLKKQVVNSKRPILFKKSRIKLIIDRAIRREINNGK